MNKKILNFQFSIFNSQAGFTFIELLITIGIVILLSSLYIPYYQRFTRRNEIKMAIQELKEVSLKAQSYALGAREQDKDLTEKKYYRFVFYPSSPIRYEIRVGDNLFIPESGDISPEKLLEIRSPEHERVVESGVLPASVLFSSGKINTSADNVSEGTFIFKTVNITEAEGDCFYAWEKPEMSLNPSYTFSNDSGITAGISLDVSSCKVEIEQ